MALMIPITAVIGSFVIAVVAIIVDGKKKDRMHKERLVAIEKGYPLPEPEEKKEKPVYATRRAWGLVWAGLGLALTIALAANPEAAEVNAWGWGLLPMFIGVGLLVAGHLDKKEWDKRRIEERNDPAPIRPYVPGGPPAPNPPPPPAPLE
jgi:hypothetical protein